MNDEWARSARIFIVDDLQPNRRLLEQILARAGHASIELYPDGHSLLAAVAAGEPDIVLLDLHMPGFDGFAVLDALRAIGTMDGYLPVLVLTGDAERSTLSRALSRGAHDFLTKPFNVEEVVLRVRNLLETRRLHLALRGRNAELADEVAVKTQALVATEMEWATVTAALGRLSAHGTPEDTAAAICAELAALPDLDAVAVYAFDANGTTVPLAVDVPGGSRLTVSVPLAEGRSAELHARAAAGAWVEPWTVDPKEQAPIGGTGPTALAYAPLRSSRGALGLLAVGATGRDGIDRLTRRLPAIEAFAAHAAVLLGPSLEERQRGEAIREQIREIIATGAYTPVFQPIVDLATGVTVGHEALTRFNDGARPDRRFADADAVGLGLELEEATFRSALDAAVDLPPGGWLSLNVSPALVLERDRLARVFEGRAMPIVLEITEHVPIADYAALRDAIAGLGYPVRLSVDDAGAGFASFRHIVELRPDFVKVDIGLVRAIDADPVRAALVAGMVYFALRTDSELIAEGIETDAELATLRSLAVDLGQGYLLGRPAPIAVVDRET